MMRRLRRNGSWVMSPSWAGPPTSTTPCREAALPAERQRRRAVTARVFSAAATRSSSSALSSSPSARMTSCAIALYAVIGWPAKVSSIRERTAASCWACRRSRTRSFASRGATVPCRGERPAREVRAVDRSRDRRLRCFDDRRTSANVSGSGFAVKPHRAPTPTTPTIFGCRNRLVRPGSAGPKERRTDSGNSVDYPAGTNPLDQRRARQIDSEPCDDDGDAIGDA